MTRYKASPYSSHGGAESIEGTPDTKLTAFSPEHSKEIKSYSLVKSTTTPTKTVHDPFVSASTQQKAEQKLSATAISFQPFALGLSFSSTKSMTSMASKSSAPLPGTKQHLESLIAAEESSPRRQVQGAETTKYGTFTIDTLFSRHVKVSSIFLEKNIRDLVAQSIEKYNDSDYRQKGTSRLEQIDNVVYLSMADRDDAVALYNAITRDHDNLAVEFIKPDDFNEILSPSAKGKCSAFEGQIIVQAQYPFGYDKTNFENELRGILTAKYTKQERELCAWEKIVDPEGGTFTMVAEYFDASHAKQVTQEFNGKVFEVGHSATILSVTEYRPTGIKATARSQTTPATTPTRQVAKELDLCDGMGGMSVSKGKTPEAQIIPFATPIQTPSGIAYMPTSNASFNMPFGVPVPSSAMYSPGSIGTMLTEMTPQSPFTLGALSSFAHGSFEGQSPSRFAHPGQPNLNQAVVHQSMALARGQYGSPSSGLSRQIGYLSRPPNPNRRANAGRVPHSVAMGYRRNNSAAGHHNFVDVYSIHYGADVRTTVMLRNIPNKVTQVELKTIIDQTSFGRYDFMYLRIDFSNGCNVGYAFINFVDPLDIIPFAAIRGGQKWEDFRSDKVAEVSYATIQGRDCLIQKFRNSSVMLEPEHCRPKLFFTYPSPLVGQEDRFPESDNPSKLKRSCENAENVGLFAPSAGQNLRDEQRRRRSQYDRGTSLAEQEEYGLEYQPWAAPQPRSYQ